MANRFFTSDQHFFHKRIMEICPTTRHGDTLDEMHELLIENWNKTVKQEDRVDIIGDFSFGDKTKTIGILARLKGNLYLTKGNHDHWIHPATMAFFRDDYKDIRTEKFAGRNIVMCHYPIARFDRMAYGSFHLHGHTHGDYQVEGRVLDVGIDARPQKDMGLWEWEEIVAYMEPLAYKGHHKDRTKIDL